MPTPTPKSHGAQEVMKRFAADRVRLEALNFIQNSLDAYLAPTDYSVDVEPWANAGPYWEIRLTFMRRYSVGREVLAVLNLPTSWHQSTAARPLDRSAVLKAAHGMALSLQNVAASFIGHHEAIGRL